MARLKLTMEIEISKFTFIIYDAKPLEFADILFLGTRKEGNDV